MAQNKSSAVMQQRVSTAPDELDFFPSPPWAGRALKGKPKKAASATAYTWLVWVKGAPADPRFRWIPKSRTRLERPGDYPAYLEKWAEIQAMAADAVPPGSLLC